jgi:hypothetical protein
MTNSGKIAWLAGGSGLIGKQLLDLVNKDPNVQSCFVFGRTSISGLSPKFHFVKTDFEIIQTEGIPKPDYVFCSLGTTIKKAGSQEAFDKVDRLYVINFAKEAKSRQTKHFAVVSSIGANTQGSTFYLRVKGQMQEELKALNIENTFVFQPSLLLGKRQEFRFGERLSIAVFKLIGFLFVGNLKRYKAVNASQVAKAMYTLKEEFVGGEKIIYSEVIQDY